MMAETNIFIIPIVLIVASFLIRWYAELIKNRTREIQIIWLRRCYAVSMAERLNRAWYKQIMDEYYE